MYLQLPLRQWGAGNVYLLVLSSWKVNITKKPTAVMGFKIRSGNKQLTVTMPQQFTIFENFLGNSILRLAKVYFFSDF